MGGWSLLSLGLGALSLVAGLLQSYASEKAQDQIVDQKVEERFEKYLSEKEGEGDQ